MREIASYAGLYLLFSIIFTTVLLSVIIGPLALYDKKVKSIPNEVGTPIAIAAYGLIPFLAALLSFYTLAKFWDYYPPFPKADVQQQAQASQVELEELEQNANKLRALLKEPKQLTLGQVEQALTQTLEFVEKFKAKTAQQEVLITSLKQAASEERAKADEARRLAERVQSLTREQLEAVKLLITQDAKTESQRSFMLGTLISFPIGIITSLVSTLIFRRWGRKARAALAHEID